MLGTRAAHPRGLNARGSKLERRQGDALVAQLRPEPLHAMRKYRNQSVPADRWANIEPFVLDAVALVAPACAYLAERLMVAVTPYVDWVVHVNGMQKVANVFHPVLIRRYISATTSTSRIRRSATTGPSCSGSRRSSSPTRVRSSLRR